MSNAFKYTPKNGKIEIKLFVNAKNELCFSCTNSGTGIDAQHIPLIFNRFKVLDNFENQLSKGIYTRNGIGLAMCDKKTQEKSHQQQYSISSDVSEKKTKNILVIDDQEEIRQFIIETLNSYSVIEAENGQDALDKINKFLPDLIICDVLMPVMDGLTFLQKINTSRSYYYHPKCRSKVRFRDLNTEQTCI